MDKYNEYADRRNELANLEEINKILGLPYTRDMYLPRKTEKGIILSIYKKRINKISNTIAFKELYKDIENITKLIQQNRIKELNSILNEMSFKSFVEDLVNWYLYDFDNNNNAVYDIDLHNI